MTLTLPPRIQQLIDERVRSGKYSTPEDVIAAAIATLDQQERFADWAPAELDALLADGERSIIEEGTLDGDDAFRLRQERRNSARAAKQ